MRRRLSRRERFFKWAGLVACALIGIAWGMGTSWQGTYVGSHFGVGFGRHALFFYTGVPEPYRDWFIESAEVWTDKFLSPAIHTGTPSVAVLPFWLVLAAAVLVTGLLWYRDRRPPRGHCQTCGYDLTGLPEPRCPECGEPA